MQKKTRAARHTGKFNITGWSMILLAALFIIVFSYIPIVQAFILSLKTGKGANLSFGGLANYRRLFGDRTFRTTLGNTMIYAVIEIPLLLFFAMAVAVMVNDPKLKFRGVYRTCIFLPCVTSMVSYAILFKNLFAEDGLINNILIGLHLTNAPVSFLMGSWSAKLVVITALLWRYTGYYMIFFLAGLQNIDASVYEAAELDGCSGWQCFTKITAPLLKPIIFLTSIMALNSTLQLFDEVVNLTGGGPGDATRTISEYIYDLSFKFVPSYGYASTVSYVVFFIVVLITVIQKEVMKEKDA